MLTRLSNSSVPNSLHHRVSPHTDVNPLVKPKTSLDEVLNLRGGVRPILLGGSHVLGLDESSDIGVSILIVENTKYLRLVKNELLLAGVAIRAEAVAEASVETHTHLSPLTIDGSPNISLCGSLDLSLDQAGRLIEVVVLKPGRELGEVGVKDIAVSHRGVDDVGGVVGEGLDQHRTLHRVGGKGWFFHSATLLIRLEQGWDTLKHKGRC